MNIILTHNCLKKIIPSILTVFFILSCQDEPTGSTGTNNTTLPNQTITESFGAATTADFMGQVIDEQHLPIEDAIVQIGPSITTTDSNGVFIIKNAQAYEKFAYIKVEKSGYIHGSRALVPTTEMNHVKIMLLAQSVTQTINSGATETVSLGNGASVELPGTYSLNDGSSYNGPVEVSLHFLNPNDPDMALQMPGMLLAEDLENQARMLQTFGMLAVELRTDDGTLLNLTEGSTATLKVPLDGQTLTNAPNEIPLWYFDEIKGYWIEEGSATKQGNMYVGEVSHFSFWNCDIPTDYINLCLNISDINAVPLSQILVIVESELNGSRTGITNENGEVCGIVPANQNLNLQFNLYNICNNIEIPNSAQTIGPFSSDISLDIILDSPEVQDSLETITGLFHSCDGTPVVNGYVEGSVANGGYFYSQVSDGLFEINVISCNDNETISIAGYDYDNTQTTGEINYTLTSPMTNIGTLTSCDAVEEFIQFSIDDGAEEQLFISGITANYWDASTQGGISNLQISANDQNTCIVLNGILDSNYPNFEGNYSYYSGWQETTPGMAFVECQDISFNNNGITFNLTAFGSNVGDYIDINFSGDYEDNLGNPHTTYGIIHVKRDN